MARHSKHDEDHDEHPSEAWLIALADMMTLLMVTFLMMFAISNLDLEKFKTFKEAFADGTGMSLPDLPGEGVPTVGESHDIGRAAAAPAPAAVKASPAPTDLATRRDLEQLQKKITKQLAKAGLADKVEARVTSRGLVVSVTSGVLFDTGESEVTPLGRALLDGLVPVLGSIGNDLVVEGHTDSRPISSSRYASNWELSAMRATAVARRLMDHGRLPSERVSVAGYADTRPRADLPTQEAYAKNRRVEIVVEAPPEPRAPAPAAAAPEAAPGAAVPAAPAAPAGAAAPAAPAGAAAPAAPSDKASGH